MLNLDTQGAELMICRGAAKVLENVKYINSEVTMFNAPYSGNVLFPELARYLSELGFKHIHTQLSEPHWGDAIFARH
jgi:hypothetical protein